VCLPVSHRCSLLNNKRVGGPQLRSSEGQEEVHRLLNAMQQSSDPSLPGALWNGVAWYKDMFGVEVRVTAGHTCWAPYRDLLF
jgi:hypothetical protein